MTAPAILVDGVTRRFGALTALSNVSFEVQQGEIFGLLGHNGAGKTTLIRLINGLLAPNGGTVRTLGHDPIVDGSRVRRRTGVLTEYPALDQFLSPAENLGVYAAIHGLDPAVAETAAHRLLTQLGLDPTSREPARSLSAGLKQRVALARALVHEPELLLLDEPTSNLDPLAARDVRDIVLELSRAQGRTVLLSTHNLAEAQTLCDRVAILRNGRVLAVGALSELADAVATGAVHVRVDDPQRALAALAALPVTAPVLLADGVTIELRIPHDEVPQIVAQLVRDGVAVLAVIPQTPSLEDVYVALHGAQPLAEVPA